jgi:1,4-alpha-glucan branching enzyme
MKRPVSTEFGCEGASQIRRTKSNTKEKERLIMKSTLQSNHNQPVASTESNSVGPLPRYSARRNLHHTIFFCHAPHANQVALIGDFNDWDPNTTPMAKQPDGRWMVALELSHGYHHYLFWVDGKSMLDPNAAGEARNTRNEPVSLRAIS